MSVQAGWRWCDRCYCLAFNAYGDGVCETGVPHNLGAGEYFLAVGEVPVGSQRGWRWCARCQNLCFGGAGSGDWCPAGGGHDHTGSGDYAVPLDTVPPSAQEGWRWCRACLCLSLLDDGWGRCATGTFHDFSLSRAYSVLTVMPPPRPRLSITVHRDNGVLIVNGEHFTPNGDVNVRYLNDGRTLDLRALANEIGRISHVTGYRRTEGSCTLFVRDETTGDLAIGTAGTWVPDRFPLSPVTIDPGTAIGEPDPRYE
ncbi:hypothetical protein ACFWNN_26185 [Lentzea sp. NPDC058450]|uniref:hypothetical protein n=1 Tax=Lentzea sp. NPDC058450 TaxID=3346505 RepID=UPI00365A2B51